MNKLIAKHLIGLKENRFSFFFSKFYLYLMRFLNLESHNKRKKIPLIITRNLNIQLVEFDKVKAWYCKDRLISK